MGDKNLLLVKFEDEDTPNLIEWKRLVLYEFGLGAIKKRMKILIFEDLERLQKIRQTKDMPKIKK